MQVVIPRSIVTPVLLFIALLLLLLASLSSPIIDTLDFFRIHTRLTLASPSIGIPPSQVTSATIYFGLSGFCLIPEQSSDSDFEFDRTCIDAGVGYSFSTSVDIGPWTTPNSQLLRSTLSHSLSQSLVLNPVACAVVFVAFVVSLFAVRRVLHETSLGASYATIWTTAIAAILSTAAFVVDAVVAGHIEDEIEPSPVFSVDWGIGVWVVLAAMVVTWLAVASAIVNMIWGRRARKAVQY